MDRKEINNNDAIEIVLWNKLEDRLKTKNLNMVYNLDEFRLQVLELGFTEEEATELTHQKIKKAVVAFKKEALEKKFELKILSNNPFVKGLNHDLTNLHLMLEDSQSKHRHWPFLISLFLKSNIIDLPIISSIEIEDQPQLCHLLSNYDQTFTPHHLLSLVYILSFNTSNIKYLSTTPNLNKILSKIRSPQQSENEKIEGREEIVQKNQTIKRGLGFLQNVVRQLKGVPAGLKYWLLRDSGWTHLADIQQHLRMDRRGQMDLNKLFYDLVKQTNSQSSPLQPNSQVFSRLITLFEDTLIRYPCDIEILCSVSTTSAALVLSEDSLNRTLKRIWPALFQEAQAFKQDVLQSLVHSLQLLLQSGKGAEALQRAAKNGWPLVYYAMKNFIDDEAIQADGCLVIEGMLFLFGSSHQNNLWEPPIAMCWSSILGCLQNSQSSIVVHAAMKATCLLCSLRGHEMILLHAIGAIEKVSQLHPSENAVAGRALKALYSLARADNV
eukprot:TRINITY_DN8136_c0_g1_i1.p1 TRINITY_DN8136_c0_g1~~TRINITY_DN8136_c0_g1_i1.p1  ORF type:complete len:497 (+),score=93.35 TRINITY_DN8136_c0_g1_i1:59-1549(+)